MSSKTAIMLTFNTLKSNQICTSTFVSIFGAGCSWPIFLWSYHSHTQDVPEEVLDNDSLHCPTGTLSNPVSKANRANPKGT